MEAQKLADKAADTAHDVAEDMLDNAQDAVRTTRSAANKTLDKAERKVRELQSDVDPLIDDLAARAQDLASRGIAYCADTGERARRQFNQAADATARYVSSSPASRWPSRQPPAPSWPRCACWHAAPGAATTDLLT